MKKRIALIAHDNMKDELLEWVKSQKEILKNHELCGTGTTSRIISESTGLNVFAYKSGPFGGDLQIGAKVAEGEIDIIIFFWDPMESQPHDPDIKALLRIAVMYDIPIATNWSTADSILSSPLFEKESVAHVIFNNFRMGEK